MPRWQFIIADTSGEAQGELTTATGRTLTFNLDDSSTASFSLPGLHPDALLPQLGETDLIVYRWSDTVGQTPTLMFRGRIDSDADDVDSDTDTVSFTARDYRGMLSQRFVWAGDTLTYTAVEQVTIGWDLIAATQAKSGGDWGITDGSTSTSTPRTRTFNIGAAIADTITTLADTEGGFDWEIGPDMVYRTWFPARGRIADVQLDYPGKLSAFSGGGAIASYGNAVLTTGASTIDSVAETASGFGSSGRLEQIYSDPDITDTTTLTNRANFELAFASQSPRTWSVTLKPGTWSPADLWLGDVVGLYIRRGRLNVNQATRVSSISIDVDDEGLETVSATLGSVLILRDEDVVADSTATDIVASDSVINAPSVAVPTLRGVLSSQAKSIAVATRNPGVREDLQPISGNTKNTAQSVSSGNTTISIGTVDFGVDERLNGLSLAGVAATGIKVLNTGLYSISVSIGLTSPAANTRFQAQIHVGVDTTTDATIVSAGDSTNSTGTEEIIVAKTAVLSLTAGNVVFGGLFTSAACTVLADNTVTTLSLYQLA